VAEWWVKHPRVERVLSGGSLDRPTVEAKVTIPSEIASIRSADPQRARQIQEKASEELRAAFDRGLVVVGFDRSANSGTYLLGKWESN
jgi:predicted GNAT superfamily acetyltransferase